MKYAGIGLLVLVAILGLTWLVQGNNFFLYNFFAPKLEDSRREVFENTKSYQQGYLQELENMQFEWVKAAPEQKDALASIILHRAADFDQTKLTPELREFIDELRKERRGP
jgi:hypothetical protein